MPSLTLQTALKYVESLLIAVLFIGAGYLLHREDPCFIHEKIDVSILMLALVTLFFGWPGLFSFLLIYGLALYLFYPHFPVYQLLELTILGLVLYLFYYLWETRLKSYALQKEYFRKKLDENSNAFYTLKASYDQLEKAYITKPHSLKESVARIVEISTENPKEAKREFLKLLSQRYHVKKASVAIFDADRHIRTIDALEPDAHLDRNDLLIEEALEKGKPVYIDFEREENQTDYLAAIPFALSENATGMLVIEDMLFTSFDKDTLLEISVIFSYFMQNLEREHFLKRYNCRRHYLSEAFTFELCRMEQIEQEKGVPSSMIILRSADEAMMRRLYHFLSRRKRTIDIIQTLTIGGREFVIILLFPFLKKAGVEGFVSRMYADLSSDASMKQWLHGRTFRYEIIDASFSQLEKNLQNKS